MRQDRHYTGGDKSEAMFGATVVLQGPAGRCDIIYQNILSKHEALFTTRTSRKFFLCTKLKPYKRTIFLFCAILSKIHHHISTASKVFLGPIPLINAFFTTFIELLTSRQKPPSAQTKWSDHFFESAQLLLAHSQ